MGRHGERAQGPQRIRQAEGELSKAQAGDAGEPIASWELLRVSRAKAANRHMAPGTQDTMVRSFGFTLRAMGSKRRAKSVTWGFCFRESTLVTLQPEWERKEACGQSGPQEATAVLQAWGAGHWLLSVHWGLRTAPLCLPTRPEA